MEQQFTVCFHPEDLSVQVSGGTILQAMITAGLHPDAPCGGNGSCKKCLVTVAGQQVLACQTAVDRDMTVVIRQEADSQILTHGIAIAVTPDQNHRYTIAFDVGTTTVVSNDIG